jgi:hypothetical protein
MSLQRFSRRQIGLLYGVSLVGTAGYFASTPTSESTESTSPQLSLESLSLSNPSSERKTVSLRVLRDEPIVHEQSYQLEAFDAASQAAGKPTVEPPVFDREPAAWVVEASTDDGEQQTRLLFSDLPYERGCIDVTVRVTTDGFLTLLTDTPECPSEG